MGRFFSDYHSGNAAMAFRNGTRNDSWHRLGTEMPVDGDRQAWLKASDLAWHAVKVPAFYEFEGKTRNARDRAFMVRSDTGAMLGDNCVTDIYQACQPSELDSLFDQYIGVDDRFQRDVMGHFKGGSIIWMTAIWRESLEIAGENHVARFMATTSFDGSASTRAQMCITRPVCDNTIAAAHGEARGAVVTIRHNTKFNAEKVGRELAGLAQSVAAYKKIGDAMATVHMSQDELKEFFKRLLDIPLEAKKEEISTRKFNQYRALWTAVETTRRERGVGSRPTDLAPLDCWQALQAVTRYVDHDRTSINGDNGEKQFLSANFGSGDALKGQAMTLLMPRVKDLIAA